MVTTIVLETNTCIDWLKAGHRFARTVLESSIQPFASDIFSFPAPGDFDPEIELIAMEKYYAEGLNKMREFLAGADLFRVREQNKMAAFMLHQAAEHGLRAILKTGTGYHCITHSIERLLRYGSMVSYMLPDIFPEKTEKDKCLFRLLQNAYSDARYKDDYNIHVSDLLSLTEKIRHIQELLEKVGRTYIYTQEPKH
jgi:HEPN domain-containing protein